MAMMETARKMKEPFLKAKETPSQGRTQDVEFTFYAPAARRVSLAGKFNDWNTTSMPMKKDKDGTWRTTVKLMPGRYEYKYFVDGSWAQDVPGAEMVPNAFGTRNCVIGVA